MRTAMIAALSCALLCGSLPSRPVWATTCAGNRGAVKLTLNYLGSGPTGNMHRYEVGVAGNSALRFPELTSDNNIDRLKMYLVVGKAAPTVMRYARRVDYPADCVSFAAQFGSALLVFGPGGVGAEPVACFSPDGFVNVSFHFMVPPGGAVEPGKLGPKDVRLYSEGRSKEGKEFILFDSRATCEQ